MEDTGTLKTPLALEQPHPASIATVRAIALIAIVLLTFAALWPTTASLIDRWSDTVSRAYTHGTLIVLISCIFLWRRRATLASVEAQHSWFAFAVTAALGIVWLVVYRSGVQVGHQLLLPLVCFGLVWTVFGRVATRRVLIPIGYLYFALPIWDLLNPLLQWLSVFAVRGVLSLLGIPVYFDGLEFQLPAGRFEIAGGCSGLHCFIVGLAIATMYGEWHSDTPRTRIRLLALAALFALATNWIRIAIIIVAGHLTQMQHYLVSGEHYTFGWIMFAIAMGAYFLIVRRWPAAATPAAVEPLRMAATPRAGIALASLALLAPAALPWIDDNRAAEANIESHMVPAAVPGWSHVEETSAAPRFVNADRTDAASFESAGDVVHAFDAIYLHQAQGRELADFENRPWGEGFAPVSGARAVAGGGWSEMQARDRAGTRLLVRVRYRVDDFVTTNLRHAQLVYGIASLTRDPLSSALVLRASCTDNCNAARAVLDRFMNDARLARAPEGVR
jgi:EpsI family protein